MTLTRAQIVAGAVVLAAFLTLMYFAGAATRPAVHVTAIINKDGTLHHVELVQDGLGVDVANLETEWIDQDGPR